MDHQKYYKEISRLATKLAAVPDKTEALCNAINISGPSQLLLTLEPNECFELLAMELSDHLKDILAAESADQLFIDSIITDIDSIRCSKKAIVQ
jgi:hypothetical protein